MSSALEHFLLYFMVRSVSGCVLHGVRVCCVDLLSSYLKREDRGPLVRLNTPGTCRRRLLPPAPRRSRPRRRAPWDPASARTSPPAARSRSPGRRSPAPRTPTARSGSRRGPGSARRRRPPRTTPPSRARCRRTAPAGGRRAPRSASRPRT